MRTSKVRSEISNSSQNNIPHLGFHLQLKTKSKRNVQTCKKKTEGLNYTLRSPNQIMLNTTLEDFDIQENIIEQDANLDCRSQSKNT